jgi:hypothetical protein
LVLHSVAFFAPIYALISLFVHSLDRRQKSPATLAMMDIGTGYFARLRLATDSFISMPFAGAITSLAYQSVERAVQEVNISMSALPALEGLGDDFWPQSGIVDDSNLFHLEDWSTFSRTSPAATPTPLERLF